ncbi:MAG: TIGR02391 family protein [Chloroflexota bacterium]|nr:TIGR02391 family protein [Chloroflexota bacterium]
MAKANAELTKKQEEEFQLLRLGLQRAYGSLETVIEEYGGRAVGVFSLAIGYPNVTPHTVTAVDGTINMGNKGGTQSDKDEQEGFKFLFMGAMVGIRNPKAHDNVVQADPYRTLEYLSFASLLMRKIEKGEITRHQKK